MEAGHVQAMPESPEVGVSLAETTAAELIDRFHHWGARDRARRILLLRQVEARRYGVPLRPSPFWKRVLDAIDVQASQ